MPLGIAAGRLGSFINGELWGRETSLPWGTVFRHAGATPRHPVAASCEFALEGLVLLRPALVVLRKPRPRGQVSALFLIGYGAARFFVEFAREPDAFLGFLALGLSMGQWLCVPMIAAGLWMFAWSRR